MDHVIVKNLLSLKNAHQFFADERFFKK